MQTESKYYFFLGGGGGEGIFVLNWLIKILTTLRFKKKLQQRWLLLNVRTTQVAYESHQTEDWAYLKLTIIFYHYVCLPADCWSIGIEYWYGQSFTWKKG